MIKLENGFSMKLNWIKAKDAPTMTGTKAANKVFGLLARNQISKVEYFLLVIREALDIC